MDGFNDAFYEVSFQHRLDRLDEATLKFLAAEQDYVLAHISRSDIALESGCGTGRLLKVLGAHVGHITGLDYSSVQLEEANRNTANYRDKISLVLGDARNPPLPSARYDLIILAYNLLNSLNVPEEESKLEVLSHTNRLLVPSGRLIMTTWAENAQDIQLELYKNWGLNAVEVTEDYVHVRSDKGVDLLSGRSSPQKLQHLLGQSGFEGSIERLTNYSYACLATKLPQSRPPQP